MVNDLSFGQHLKLRTLDYDNLSILGIGIEQEQMVSS